MRIRTRLQINSWVSLLIMAIMTMFLMWSCRKASETNRYTELIAALQKAGFERTVLRDEYLVHKEKRVRLQWEAKTEEFAQLLGRSEKDCSDVSDKELLKKIRKDFDGTLSLFRRIAKNYEVSENIGTDSFPMPREDKHLLSQIFTKAHSMMQGIGRLRASVAKKSDAAYERHLMMTIILVIAAFIITIINSLSINRVLAKRISQLRKGMEIIASGNFEYAIAAEGDDELTDLAAASNEMAARLMQSYTSIENLNLEIARRRQAEEEFRTTLYSIGDAVITTDTDGRIKQMNAVAENLTGWTEADAGGELISNVFHIVSEETGAVAENPVYRVLNEGAVVGLANHTVLIAKDGYTRPIADSGAPIRDDRGDITGVVLVFRDQSEERAAQKALEQSESRYRKAQALGKVGNWEYHLQTACFWGSDEAKRIYGFDPETSNFTTDEVENCIPERDRVHQALIDLIEKNAEYNLEFDIITKNMGERKTIVSLAQLEKDSNGNPLKITGVIQDITERKRIDTAFRESEQRYRMLVETANEGIWSMDADHLTTFVNRSMAEMLGYTTEEILGRKVEDFFFPEDMDFHQERMKERHAGKDEVYERRFRRKDGSLLWTLVTANVLKDDRGNFAGSFAMFTDITARKKAEEALWESIREYRSLFENMISGFAYHQMIFDDNDRPTDYVFLEINNAFEKHTGLTRDIIGKRVTDIHPGIGKSDPDFIGIYGNVALTGKPVRFDVWFEPQQHWYTISAYSPKKGYFAAVFDDITERRRMEKELRRKTEELSIVLDTIPALVWIAYDPECSLITGNRAVSELFKVSEGTNVSQTAAEAGKAVRIRHLREDGTELRAEELPMQKAIALGQPILNDEFIYDLPDGRQIYALGNAVPLFDENGSVRGAVGAFFDITERRRAEEALAESEERFLLAMKASNDGLFDWNLETNEIYYSPAWKNMLGYEDHELPNDFTIWENKTDPEDVKKSWELQKKLISKEIDRFVMEFKMKHKDGYWVYILSRAEAIFNDSGKAVRIVGTHTDISERKRMEESLQTRLNLREYADSHTLDELLQYTLDTAEQLTRSQIGFFHFFNEEQKTLTLQMWSDNTLKNMCTAEGRGAHYPVEKAGVWADCVRQRQPVIHNDYAGLPQRKGMPEGHAPVVRELTVPVIRGNRIMAIIGVGNKSSDYTETDVRMISELIDISWDIISGKLAENALKESEEKFYKAFHSSPAVMSISTLDEGIFLDANAQFLKITELTRQEVIGHKASEIGMWRSGQRHKILSILKANGFAHNVEIELTTKSGKIIPLLWFGDVIHIRNKPCLIVTGYDLSERKKAEDRIRASLKEKEVLLREIHHRVKNNLMVVNSLIQMQSEETSDPNGRSLFRDLNNRVMAMAMVHEDLYRSENLAEIDFAEYLERLLSNIRHGFSRASVNIRISASDIFLDVDKAIPCGLIVAELVTNAFKYAFSETSEEKNPEICVELDKNENVYTLTVSDNGVGIPADIDWHSPKTLGLELVQAWVSHQLKGVIDADTRHGTEFIITFKDFGSMNVKKQKY